MGCYSVLDGPQGELFSVSPFALKADSRITCSTLIRTLAPASWLASHLTFIHTNGPLLTAASSPAMSASASLNGHVSPSQEKMSALFL